MSSANRLGDLLVREKLISLQQLRQAQEEQIARKVLAGVTTTEEVGRVTMGD